MSAEAWLLMAALMALAAALYSTVGHGGASAYIAIMALFAVAPHVMRPTALTLNLIVAGIATWRYGRAGQVNWRLVMLFAATAAPAAYVAGSMPLAPSTYRMLVGVLLLAAAARLLWNPMSIANGPPVPPKPWVAMPLGAGLGALAGLTGTGGGIFLSPLIILFGWENPRKTSGVAAAFILINSIAGLAGNVGSLGVIPETALWLAAAVAAGATAGTYLGTLRLDRHRLLQALGLVLTIAGGKLLLT